MENYREKRVIAGNTAKLFVEEGTYAFIAGRRKKELDEAAKAIGDNVTGVPQHPMTDKC